MTRSSSAALGRGAGRWARPPHRRHQRPGRTGRQRVVSVSSSPHRTWSIQQADPAFSADPRVTAVSVHPGVCVTALLPLHAHEGGSAAEAPHTWSGRAFYDRDERADPAPAGDRAIRRLNKPADLLAGRTARRSPTAAKPAGTDDEQGRSCPPPHRPTGARSPTRRNRPPRKRKPPTSTSCQRSPRPS
ncbi:hypothetical protein [Streptomyces sp. NPDC004546]|uniref:hypothetical protein n=1 Tax=Streptomyces sp. NPDC004546 TaxID=3154282 RepID=UPI0033BB4081